MGVVVRESIKSSFASYAGLIIGMVNAIFLYTKFLTPEQLGLTRVLQDSTLLFVSFAQLGSPFIIIKFFPQFADKSKNHNGFLFFVLTYSFIGFIAFAILFVGLQTVYLSFYQNKSPLLVQYFLYIIPLVFAMVYINVLESYILIQNKLFLPTFVREVFLKLSNTITIILFALGYINFTNFLNLMVLSYFLAVLFLTFYVKKLNSLFLRPNFKFWKIHRVKSIFNYGFFTVLGGIGFLIASKIDTIMLPAFQGLKETAIYSIALLMATVMEIPKRSLVRAVLPSLSFAIKEDDHGKIDDIYKKTSINLFIFGLLIFILVWVNIDDLFKIIPRGDIYVGGKTVLYFFLFSRMMDLVTGVNNEIILYSKFYKYSLILIIVLGLLTIVTNLIFIPIYGILGAAIATTMSLVIYLLLELVIVWKKFHSQPFSLNTIKALGLFLIIWALADLLKNILSGIPVEMTKSINDKFLLAAIIVLKTVILSTVFIYSYIKLKISNDFSGLILSALSKIKNSLKLN